MMKLSIFIVALVPILASAFLSTPGKNRIVKASALKMSSYLEELPQEAKQECLYGMVYVERLPEPVQTTGGLFLPGQENPRRHICRVVSVGPGVEGESGAIATSRGLAPGDYVYVKNPWGIGAKDEQFGRRKFSFLRYNEVCGTFDAGAAMEAEISGLKKAEELEEELGGIGLASEGKSGQVGDFKF